MFFAKEKLSDNRILFLRFIKKVYHLFLFVRCKNNYNFWET